MKNFILLLLLFPILLFSVEMTQKQCETVAQNHLYKFSKTDFRISDYYSFDIASDQIGYVFELSPTGFIIVPANNNLKPITAYSFSSKFSTNEKVGAMKFIKKILKEQLKNLNAEQIENMQKEWEDYLKGNLNFRFTQWPPEGYSDTEGWVLTRWNQIYPYNKYCPIDPITHIRSYAGCPAVAISQIINYYKNIHQVSFGDADDYYHSFAGRNYHIDDDYEEISFASYPELNTYLDSLDNKYLYSDESLTSQDKGALIFATGVAAQQVYSSEVSGVFYEINISNSFNKFHYSNEMIFPDEDDFFDRMIENIQNAMPIQLSLLTDSETEGHQVVLDGYNSDDYYHINFGWGGSSDGWYNFANHDMPYSLNVISCAFVDITPQNLPTALIMGNIALNPIPESPANQIHIKAISNQGSLDFDFSASTSSQNTEYFLSLPIGKYQLEISYPDYETFTVNNILLYQNDILTMDFHLDRIYSPENLTANYENGNIELNWEFNQTRSFEEFFIYRKQDSEFEKIATTTDLSYIDHFDTPISDTLFYFVTAKYSQDNESAPSDTVFVLIPASSSENCIQTQDTSYAYPNPFNPITTIYYQAPKNEKATLKIFNLKGELVKTDKKQNSENSIFVWNGINNKGKNVSSGIYFYMIKTKSKIYKGKLTLIK